jgi:hypothetical protein
MERVAKLAASHWNRDKKHALLKKFDAVLYILLAMKKHKKLSIKLSGD